MENLPFPSDCFTKVCTVNTIFYWNDALQAFSELYRVLKKNGKLVLCFTDRKDLENRKFTKQGLSFYEVEEVQKLMTSSGFREIHQATGSDRYRKFHCMVGYK